MKGRRALRVAGPSLRPRPSPERFVAGFGGHGTRNRRQSTVGHPLRVRALFRYVAQESGKRLPTVTRADPKDGGVASQQWRNNDALAPFGGIGQCGLRGRSGGDADIQEFTERRWVAGDSAPAPCPY